MTILNSYPATPLDVLARLPAFPRRMGTRVLGFGYLGGGGGSMSVYDQIDDEYCAELGLDAKRVLSAVRRLNKAAKELSDMGLVIFGGMGTGTLRSMNHDPSRLIATFSGHFDGGDGGHEKWD